jgi:CHAT domain-containing protein
MEIRDFADGSNVPRLFSKEAPKVTVIRGLRIVSSPAAQCILDELNIEAGNVGADLTEAIWAFGPQSNFTLKLSSADIRTRETKQLVGSYSVHDSIIEFHAESRPAQGAVISFDGTIDREGDQFQMEGIYSACSSISVPIIARVGQLLQEAPEPFGEIQEETLAANEAQPAVSSLFEGVTLPGNEWIQEILGRRSAIDEAGDIPIPSFFDIVLEGKTETSSFGPLAGTLIIALPLPSDPHRLSVTLVTEGPCSNGWLSWRTEGSSFTQHADQPERFEVSVVGNTIRVDLIANRYAEPTTWYTIPKNAATANALTPVRIRRATLWLDITDRTLVSGKLQASGIYDWDYLFELPSSFEATISGRVKGSAEVGLVRDEAAHRGFGGKWLCDDSRFGIIELTANADQVCGQFCASKGGTLQGVVTGNLAEFIWSDNAGGEGWAFIRLIAGGKLLAGLYGHGNERRRGHSFVTVRQSDPSLVDRAYKASDRKELRRLGIDLVLEGKLDIARQVLEQALQLYAGGWENEADAFLSKEVDLVDQASILNYLSVCYYYLGDYTGLLETLNRAVDIERRLSPFEYFRSVFSQRAAGLLKTIEQGRSMSTDLRTRVLAMQTELDSGSQVGSEFTSELKYQLSRKIDRFAGLLDAARSQLGSSFNLVADAKYRVEATLADPRDELSVLADSLRNHRQVLLDVLLKTPELLEKAFPDETELLEDAARVFQVLFPEKGRDVTNIDIEALAAIEKQIYEQLRASARLTPLEISLFADHLKTAYLSHLPLQFELESDFITAMDIDHTWESQDQLMRSSALQLAGTLENWRARLLTDLDKIAALDQAQPFFQRLIRFFISSGKPEEALLIAETGRARAFIDMMASGLNPSPQPAPAQTYQNIVVNLMSAPPPSIEMIKRASFQHDATIVYYAIVQDDHEALYIWVIQPNGPIMFRSVSLDQDEGQPATSIEDLTNNMRFHLGIASGDAILDNQSNSSTITSVEIETPRDARPISQSELAISTEGLNTTLRALYQLLIAPVSTLLPDSPDALVIFIPQGSLFLVPFACLQETTGRCLIDQHTILVAPSIQLLDLIRQRRERVMPEPGKRVLVMGNPVMPSVRAAPDQPAQQLRSLRGAEREAKAVAAAMNTTAMIGNEAAKATAMRLMGESRVIHLATHALLDDLDGSGMPGAIALAPSEGDSGLMTAREVLGLKLEADLVVLSACNTARGKTTGDGVIGLSRSLLLAGASSVIVSLWSVEDEATAFLMNEFYRNYASGVSKAAALRKAALRARDLYHNPAKWSAFTLVGEAI